MSTQSRRTLERLLHPDAPELRWYFSDAPGLISGLRAAPIEPLIKGTELESDRYQAADAEVRRSEMHRRFSRLHETMTWVTPSSASVLLACFSRASSYPMVPSEAWLPEAFGDLAAVVYMRSTTLGTIVTPQWKTHEGDRTRAMSMLAHHNGSTKLRDQCLSEVYVEVINAAEEWHARKSKRAAA